MNLTTRQQQILDFIISHLKANGFPPTRRNIADNFGFKSDNAAECHLRALERKGAITLHSGTARGIELA